MKKAIMIICFIISGILAYSQENKTLYSGGMLFLQPGYALAENPSQKIKSFGFGIGGLLRFYIKEHLVLGIIGGSQKTKYKSFNSENSYISLGYGGPFAGYTLAREKFRLCAAISIGMGKIKNLHIIDQENVVLNDAYYYDYSAKIAYRMISFDYHLTKKLSAVCQAIFLAAHYNKNDVYLCPVLQIGIVFNR